MDAQVAIAMVEEQMKLTGRVTQVACNAQLGLATANKSMKQEDQLHDNGNERATSWDEEKPSHRRGHTTSCRQGNGFKK